MTSPTIMKEIAIFLENLAKALDESPYPTGGMADNCRYFKNRIEEELKNG